MAVFSSDLLFLHIPKTGGWSAKHYLRDNVPGMTFPKDHDDPFPIGHIPLRDVQTFSGRAPDSFERIVVVIRNPYDQQLSQWMFWRDRFARGGRHVHDIHAALYPDLTHWLLDPMCDFHVWYEETVGQARKTVATERGYNDFGGYYRYWLEVDGEIPPNVVVVRMEEIETAFPAAVADYARPDPAPFPHMNAQPKRAETQAYYTPLARRLVEEKFTWAFAGYYERWAAG